MVLHFTDPDEYTASVRATTAEISITKPGRFTAKLIRIDLDRLWMQRFSETLPRIAHLADVPGRAIISFPTQANSCSLPEGSEMPPNAMKRHSEGHSRFEHSTGPVHSGSMSLPIADMEALGASFAGSDFTPPRDLLTFGPPPAAMARLQRLHQAAGHLAEHSPEVIANPEAARGLEQALIHAMAACLNTTDRAHDTLARRRHAAIMRRFHAAIVDRPAEAPYVADLCAILGVPERTLRLCCHESLGMGPKRYLLLRRMNLARQALRNADAATASVTGIATKFGFWNLGRFAVEYNAFCGEAPSATLRDPPP